MAFVIGLAIVGWCGFALSVAALVKAFNLYGNVTVYKSARNSARQ